MAEDVAEVTESLPKETGLVGLDGPLDELDLTKMLAESFEPEEQERSEETSSSGDAVEEAEPVEESTEEAGDTEHVLSQEESETESEVEAAPEQSEPQPGEQEEPEWLQRRIDRFTRKLRLAEEERDELEHEVQSLKSQVEQVPAAVQQNGNPVAHIRNERELNDIASLAERRLEFAEEMEDRLLDNPEAVEKILRQQGVELTDNDGDEDFGSARMTRFIRQIRRDSTNKLNRWVPARQTELRQAKEFNAQAEKLYPWLKPGKEDSKEMQLFQQVLAASPQAAYAPNHKLELARYVRGYMAELGDQTKKVTPKKVAPEPGKPTSAPAPKEGKVAKYEESKKRVFSNRDQRGLTDFVQTIIDN